MHVLQPAASSHKPALAARHAEAGHGRRAGAAVSAVGRQRHVAYRADSHHAAVAAPHPRQRAAAAGAASSAAGGTPGDPDPAPHLDAAPAAGPGAQPSPPPASLPAVPIHPPPLSIERQILAIALPTLATLAADPLASLVSTGFVGRLGAAPLASAGVALSVYNSLTKLLNMPLLAVTTSSVAQAVGAEQGADTAEQHSQLSDAVSASLILALLTGLAQAAILGLCGTRSLAVWGAAPGGPLHADAAAYLGARALAAPATVMMLVLQGCFRGLGDTRIPFIATLLANVLNIVLEPLLIFTLGWGVRGAATAVGLSQAVACVVLLLMLSRRCQLRLVGGPALQRSLQYLRPTGLLAIRTLAVTAVYSLATSIVARTGPAHAASHQIAFQVWLASSLLADSLAVAAQTLLARSIAAGQQEAGQTVVRCTLQMALSLGCVLAVALTVARGSIAHLFSQDPAVLASLAVILPAVIATQPINALAFLMDGVLYGCGGFQYAATAMVAACIPAVAAMLLGSRAAARLAAGAAQDGQLVAVWEGLATLMVMRFVTLYIPLLKRSPPFDKLKPAAA